jgi:hypothetical protein
MGDQLEMHKLSKLCLLLHHNLVRFFISGNILSFYLIFSGWNDFTTNKFCGNNKEFVVGVFCDLTRAFDCVNHDLLIRKLEYYGVKGSILK